MEKIKQELLTFAEQVAKSRKCTVGDVIKELHLEFILYDRLSLQDKAYAIGLELSQKKKNHIYVQELETLQNICGNLPIIVFKGLASAYGLYANPSMRMSKDIDILIEEDKCLDIENALVTMGYKSNYNYKNYSHLFYKCDLYAECAKDNGGYFDSYKKNHRAFFKKVEGIQVEIEVHTHLFSPIRYPKISMSQFFCKHKEVWIDSQYKIKTLSEENNLLCLICHMCKHMSHSIINPQLTQCCFSMKEIIDIKLLIEKKRFDWDKLCKLTCNWEIEGSFLLGLRMINYVFPKTIPADVIQKLILNVSKKHGKKSHESLLNKIALLSMDDIFDYDFKSFFRREVIDTEEKCWIIKENQKESDEIEFKSNKMHVLVTPSWNEDEISFAVNYLIEGSIIVIGLSICSNISPLYSTNVFFKIQGDKVFISTEYMDSCFIKSENIWLENIKFQKENSNLFITIPWKCINIEPMHGKRLPFAFKAILWNDNEILLDYMSVPTDKYYDCYGLGSISLS